MRKAVNGIVIKDGKVLLVRKRNIWIFPGGKLETGESDIECLKREFREELLITKTKSYIFYDTFKGKTPHVGDNLEAKAYFVDIEGELIPSREIKEVRYFMFNEIDNYKISDISNKILKSLNKRGYL